jgi:hypothetical protein
MRLGEYCPMLMLPSHFATASFFSSRKRPPREDSTCE